MKVKIGGIDYAVIRVKDLHSEQGIKLDGCIVHNQFEICLDEDLAPTAVLQTLWHEILHGILVQSGFTEHNEQIVDLLAFGIVSALTNNGKRVLPG